LTLCNCGESKTSEYESKSLYKLKLFYWVEMIWTNTKRHEMYIIYIKKYAKKIALNSFNIIQKKIMHEIGSKM